MAFNWTEPVSAGLIIYHLSLQEVHDNLDHIVDNLHCGAHDAIYLVGNESGVLSVDRSGYQSAYDASELTNNNSGVLATHKSSDLTSNNSGYDGTKWSADLSGYNGPVLVSHFPYTHDYHFPGDHGADG